MPHHLPELKALLSDGKIVHESVSAVEKRFYNEELTDFSSYYEHKELCFRLPYTRSYEDDITRIVKGTLPDYDMIIWRVPPEVTLFQYMRPIAVDFSIMGQGMPIPEANFVEFHDKLTREDRPDFLKFYTRFSLGKNNRQVELKFRDVA